MSLRPVHYQAVYATLSLGLFHPQWLRSAVGIRPLAGPGSRAYRIDLRTNITNYWAWVLSGSGSRFGLDWWRVCFGDIVAAGVDEWTGWSASDSAILIPSPSEAAAGREGRLGLSTADGRRQLPSRQELLRISVEFSKVLLHIYTCIGPGT